MESPSIFGISALVAVLPFLTNCANRTVNRPEDAEFRENESQYVVQRIQSRFGEFRIFTPSESDRRKRQVDSSKTEIIEHEGNRLAIRWIDGKALVALSGTPVLSAELIRGEIGTIRLEVPLLSFARVQSARFPQFHASLERRIGAHVFYVLETECPSLLQIKNETFAFRTDQKSCRLNQPIVGQLDRAPGAGSLESDGRVSLEIPAHSLNLLGLARISVNASAAFQAFRKQIPTEHQPQFSFGEVLDYSKQIATEIHREILEFQNRSLDFDLSNIELDLALIAFKANSSGKFELRGEPRAASILESNLFERVGSAPSLTFEGTGATSMMTSIPIEVLRTSDNPWTANVNATRVELPVTLKAGDSALLRVVRIRAQTNVYDGAPTRIENDVCVDSTDGCARGHFECTDPNLMTPNPNGERRCSAWTCTMTSSPDDGRVYLRHVPCSDVPAQMMRYYVRTAPCLATEPVPVRFCGVIPAPSRIDIWTPMSGITPSQNYHFSCEEPVGRCNRRENQWVNTKNYSVLSPSGTFEDLPIEKYQSVVLNASSAATDADVIVSRTAGRQTISIRAVRDVSVPSIALASDIHLRRPCGERLEQWNQLVTYRCAAPNRPIEQRSMSLADEAERRQRGEPLEIVHDFFPDHLINFEILVPNRNEVPL